MKMMMLLSRLRLIQPLPYRASLAGARSPTSAEHGTCGSQLRWREPRSATMVAGGPMVEFPDRRVLRRQLPPSSLPTTSTGDHPHEPAP